MSAWWATLTGLERFFAYVAFPATLLLILQTLMLLFGLGHDGGDASDSPDLDGDLNADFDLDTDLDADGIPDLDGSGILDGVDGFHGFHGFHDGPDGHDAPDGHDTPDGGHQGLFSGLKLLTLRGIVAFLAVCGWGGLWLLRMGMHPIPALFLAVAMGFWAMLLMALFLKVALQLQSDGTMDLRNALGKAGTVYLTVPAGRSGVGKVTVLFQDQFQELSAVTDDPEHLPTGTEVVVVGISGSSTLVVCRK